MVKEKIERFMKEEDAATVHLKGSERASRQFHS
jgi:hypothetical protein